MTARERVLAVLSHARSDRVPFDIWYTPEVRDQLLAYFQLSEESQLWEALEIDKIVMVDAPYLGRVEPRCDSDGRLLTMSEWGSGSRTVAYSAGGSYEEVVHYPLAAATSIDQIEAYRWPDPALFDYVELARSCEKHSKWTRMLTFISLFEIYCKLRPFELSLMDLYSEPELADTIIHKIYEIQMSYIERAFKACHDGLDIVYLSDDMGMQDRLLIGEDVWEARFLQPYRDLINLIHANGALAFYHSDGAAFPILTRMVDLGVDVINPIQHTCPQMGREELVQAFGDRIAFHGAVENQRVLPFGTPHHVIAEVRRDIAILGSFGRYICAPCHNIQPGTPLENILALYRCERSW